MHKKIIVVVGPGRSGTSLIMQLLSSFNISSTTYPIDSNDNNPKGFWEDKEIVKLEREFLEKKKPAHLPIPTGDFEDEEALYLKNQIKEILLDSLEKSEGLFAIKDPKITLLFPIWKKIFYECGLEPIYIFACRNPTAFIDSNKKILGDKITQEVLEWEWYYRTVSSFYFTDSKIFIVHYEDWFADLYKQAYNLLEYIGIGYEKDIVNAIDHSLNRSGEKNIILSNSSTIKCYDLVSRLKGTEFIADEIQLKMESLWDGIWDHVNWLYPEFKWRNRRINILENNIKLLNATLSEKNEEIENKDKEIKKRELDINQKRQNTLKLEHSLSEIKASNLWKVQIIFQKIRNKLSLIFR
jgi:hypothetical protein